MQLTWVLNNKPRSYRTIFIIVLPEHLSGDCLLGKQYKSPEEANKFAEVGAQVLPHSRLDSGSELKIRESEVDETNRPATSEERMEDAALRAAMGIARRPENDGSDTEEDELKTKGGTRWHRGRPQTSQSGKSVDRGRSQELKERDLIQEEADRAYREIIIARKIVSEVIRSREPIKEDIVRIVTLPGFES